MSYIKIFSCKRLLIFLTIIILFSLSFTFIDAHTGRTDSKDGHRDTSTGTYHYHHGYPAHKHTDGICPYDDADNEKIYSSDTSNDNDNNTAKLIKSLLCMPEAIALLALLFIYIVYRVLKHIYQEKQYKAMNAFNKNFNKRNKDVLYETYIKLIELYELENALDIPTCKSDLSKWFYERTSSKQAEIANLDDTTDYHNLAHKLLSHATFDLLTSGKYHIYRGTLDPLTCADNLMFIHKKALEYGIKIGEITDDDKNKETLYLKKCISEVG